MTKWVYSFDRLPTIEDADGTGCVLVWNIHIGVMISRWDEVKLANIGNVPCWRPMPAAPEDFQRRENEWKRKMREGAGERLMK